MKIETAYDWWQRCQQHQQHKASEVNITNNLPQDPIAAAWHFVRPPPLPARVGTSRVPKYLSTMAAPSTDCPVAPSSPTYPAFESGIAYIDAALRHNQPTAARDEHKHDYSLPVMDLCGDVECGKTWTLLTLAARFVVATRPSQFVSCGTAIGSHNAPQVFLLDSYYGATASQVAHVVRSSLLRATSLSLQQQQDNEHDRELQFQQDWQDCLQRIHVTQTHVATDWVAVLELLRQHLQLGGTGSAHRHPPSLILWDGCSTAAWNDDDNMDNNNNNNNDPENVLAQQEWMEAQRQWIRLIQEVSSTALIVTTSRPSRRRGRPIIMTSSSSSWDRFVTHRIRLERDHKSASLEDNQYQENDVPSTNNSSRVRHSHVAVVQGLSTSIPFSISLSGIFT